MHMLFSLQLKFTINKTAGVYSFSSLSRSANTSCAPYQKARMLQAKNEKRINASRIPEERPVNCVARCAHNKLLLYRIASLSSPPNAFTVRMPPSTSCATLPAIEWLMDSLICHFT